ncbi:MAG: hypothetical protein M1837_006848 [Sclerophora amabilis]|nr:MAG: hypothetical protein M1837_006848 [Sclerophora amabilis]
MAQRPEDLPKCPRSLGFPQGFLEWWVEAHKMHLGGPKFPRILGDPRVKGKPVYTTLDAHTMGNPTAHRQLNGLVRLCSSGMTVLNTQRDDELRRNRSQRIGTFSPVAEHRNARFDLQGDGDMGRSRGKPPPGEDGRLSQAVQSFHNSSGMGISSKAVMRENPSSHGDVQSLDLELRVGGARAKARHR